MTLLSVVMSIFILLHSYKSAAKECTASLLRAKPPKNGKRILLERITWLWSRFSFNTKMVVRNLMRNKLRTIMMLVGLLCCTMLIITSLGLQDSVTSLSVKYYTKSLDYDVIANLTGTVDKAESYERRADADAAECLMEKSVSLRTDAGTRTERLTVLEDDQTMIHLGKDETFVPLETGTAAITYKLTKTLNLHVGDTVRVYLPGDDRAVYHRHRPNRLQQRHAGHLSQPHDMGIPPQGRIRPHRPDAQEPGRNLSRPAGRHG